MMYRALVLTSATYAVAIFSDWMAPKNAHCVQTALNIGLRATIMARGATRLGVLWGETDSLRFSEIAQKRQLGLFFYRPTCYDAMMDRQGYFYQMNMRRLRSFDLDLDRCADSTLTAHIAKAQRRYLAFHTFDLEKLFERTQM